MSASSRSFLFAALLALPIALLWGGCDNGVNVNANAPKKDGHHHDNPHHFKDINHAVVVLSATQGNNVTGQIGFVEKDGKVHITGQVSGLTPNQKHAWHIHEYGNISSPDGTATGGHYNPEGHDHALPDKDKRHAGDLGNLTADAQGQATIDMTVDNITVAGMKNPIIGRAIIVHAKEDDGGQPTGNAGGRIAQGVIGIAKNPDKDAAKAPAAK